MALDLFDALPPHSADGVSLGAALSAMEKGHEWPQALLLLATWGEPLGAEAVGYNAAISAMEKGFQWQRALELLRQLKAFQSGVSAPEIEAKRP